MFNKTKIWLPKSAHQYNRNLNDLDINSDSVQTLNNSLIKSLKDLEVIYRFESYLQTSERMDRSLVLLKKFEEYKRHIQIITLNLVEVLRLASKLDISSTKPFVDTFVSFTDK